MKHKGSQYVLAVTKKKQKKIKEKIKKAMMSDQAQTSDDSAIETEFHFAHDSENMTAYCEDNNSQVNEFY